MGVLEDEKQNLGQAGRGKPSLGVCKLHTQACMLGGAVRGEGGAELRQSSSSTTLKSSNRLGRMHTHCILLPYSDVIMILHLSVFGILGRFQ